jgi:hypothetical protein
MTDLHHDTDTIARLLTDRLEELLDALAPGWVQRRGAAYPRPNAARGALGSFRVELTGAKRGQWYRHSQDVGGGVLRLFAYLNSGEKGASLDRDVFDAARAFLGLPSPFGVGERVDSAEVARRRAEAEARAKARAAEHAKAAAGHRLKRQTRARDVWHAAQTAAGTIVEAWFAARGLPGVVVPRTIRFHPVLPFFVGEETVDPATGKPRRTVRELHRGPAMVALITDGVSGRFAGVHLTWLSDDGRRKAEIRDGDEALPARRMIGQARGGYVRLAPPAKHIAVGEGLESALSVQHYGELPTFAALSLNNLGAPLPPLVEAVTLCFDNDERDLVKATRLKMAAAAAHHERGLAVDTCTPTERADFNDLAMRVAARGATAAVGSGQSAVGGDAGGAGADGEPPAACGGSLAAAGMPSPLPTADCPLPISEGALP